MPRCLDGGPLLDVNFSSTFGGGRAPTVSSTPRGPIIYFRVTAPKILLLCILAAMSAMLICCRTLPDLEGRSVTTALADTADTKLGHAIAPVARAHPDKSGVFALADGRDAFAARALLARAADRSIDVQYYIWRHDMSGTLLFEELHDAADRGVRVRLLLDDNNTTGLDAILSMLDAHPNIEVRLFNPFMHRRVRALGFLTDFARLNRRMHNKSFTVDNQVTIVGGRNVGDEYFDAGQGPLFVDLDAMAVGPVVNDVSKDFDRYWASDSSYPVERILPRVDPRTIAALSSEALLVERDPAAAEYTEAIARLPFVRDLQASRLALEWATTHMVSDDPAKGLGRAADDVQVAQRLREIRGASTHELQLISPYFVPTAEGVEALAELARHDVDITILTNSLEATDVAAVHAGYAKRRRRLLENGIVLYEMKRSLSPPPALTDRGLPGSSGSSLHAKTFSVDRSRIFIGSFNFDPRSAHLNTENGFVIESPAMSKVLADAFFSSIPARAYQVRLSNAGSLQWIERRDGETLVHDEEPGAGFWRRAGVFILSLLPIEWLL